MKERDKKEQEKKDNDTLIRFLHNIGYNSQANKVKGCMRNVIYAEDINGYKKLKSAYFCHNRLCSICQNRKSMLDNIKLKKAVDYTENNLVDPTDKYKYLFMTLTLKNVKDIDVKATQKLINKAIIKMFNYKVLKDNVLARAKTTDITYNAKRDDYHVHAHLLLMVKPLIVNSRKRLKRDDYARLWQRATKSSYIPVVKATPLKTSQDVQAIMNYITKPMNYVEFINNHYIKNKEHVIITIYNALKYQHRTTLSGLFRVANSVLKSKAKNSFDNNRKPKNKVKFKAVAYSFYRWNFNFKYHVLIDRMSAKEWNSCSMP